KIDHQWCSRELIRSEEHIAVRVRFPWIQEGLDGVAWGERSGHGGRFVQNGEFLGSSRVAQDRVISWAGGPGQVLADEQIELFLAARGFLDGQNVRIDRHDFPRELGSRLVRRI